jgi:hypothetical protein
MFPLSFIFPVIHLFSSLYFLLLGQLTNPAPADTISHTSPIVSDPLDNPQPLLGDTDPLDESLLPSGEESSHLEPEHPHDAEETYLNHVQHIAITSMCHAPSLSMY